jgi:purine-nucleoside phosphorylase
MEPMRSDICLIAGSGLADVLGDAPDHVLPFSAFPELHQPSVAGHRAEVRMYTVAGRRIMMFCGRTHMYEGVAPDVTTAPVRIAARHGARHAIITNAAGGLHPLFRTGDVMIASDLIDWTFRREPQQQRLPSPFILDDAWSARAERAALDHGVPTRRGTYMQVTGPSYETRAEIRMARRLGADAIGMSTAHEATAARTAGMSVVVCSVIANTLSDTARVALTHEEVLEAQHHARARIGAVIEACIATAQ